VRHGALLGLRGVLGRGIPVLNSSDGAIISESQEGWIDFLLCDILLILGLDRFKDFLGDQVASPVKETSAQLLSLVYKRLGSEKQGCLVSRHLRALMNFEHWEVRHAGLLSLKHILANASNVGIACQLGDRVVELLSDGDEDVRSVAADVLCTLISSHESSIDLTKIFKTIKVLLGGLDELGPSTVPILDLLVQLVGLNSSFGVESSLLLPFLRNASTKVRKQVIKVLGAMTESGDEEQVKNVVIQLIQSMAVELDREINDLTLGLVLDLMTISGIKISEQEFGKLFDIVTCPLGQIYDQGDFSVEPALHDLGFKKADMMVISEEEGIIQRLNVSHALSSILKSTTFDEVTYKEKLLKSNWVIHHLIYRWIFGSERERNVEIKFNELSGLTGTLQSEFNRFIQISGGDDRSSDRSSDRNNVNNSFSVSFNVINFIQEFNTRSEKSVESLNQLTVLESVLKEFEGENQKLNARLSVCHGRSSVDSLLTALKIETNSRLQEFYANELGRVLEVGEGEDLEINLLKELGEFLDLKRLTEGFISEGEVICIQSQRDWIEYERRDDHLWKAGKFVFKELSKSALIVGKSLNNLNTIELIEDLNWLTGLLIEIKSKEIASLVIENVSLKNLKFSGSPLIISGSALILASLVRLEIVANPNPNSKSQSLEQFVHQFLFNSGAKEIFPVILELLNRLKNRDGEVILPLIPVFLKRTLMEINDSDLMTRKFASLTFSQLVKIAPLSVKVEGLSQETEKLIGECREFLDQLQGPSTALPDFVPACPLNVEMRPYQQAGLNWLAFLRKFNLHGALCDDMGLGKTLQTLSIIASDHFEHGKGMEVRSLIVCPASLTGHWEAEVRQYCPSLEAPLLYVGPSTSRHSKLLKKLAGAEIVITSYDVLRSDSDHFSALQWNYCVLDEGHLIKNPKTKLSAAVKGLKAKRRLLLSGTPIQNNLLELWALFDFLLPGYLGSEKEFTEKYAKPILILQHQQITTTTTTTTTTATTTTTPSDGSISKWTQKDFDEAEGKLQSLHKQVLPFILRRMKEDVLSDLPPKIIQDYKCPMSSIQKILYDDLLRGSHVKSEISKFVKEKFKEELEGNGNGNVADEDVIEYESNSTSTTKMINTIKSKPTHVFQVLQYLRKLCVHPTLVLSENDALMPQINSELFKNNLKMTDLSVAPKFQMLK
jgi:SNF2 family DNA or RNA helicase